MCMVLASTAHHGLYYSAGWYNVRAPDSVAELWAASFFIQVRVRPSNHIPPFQIHVHLDQSNKRQFSLNF